MATSANTYEITVFDKYRVELKVVRINVICGFPTCKFLQFFPREDFYYIASGYDEDEVDWESSLKPLTEFDPLMADDKRMLKPEKIPFYEKMIESTLLDLNNFDESNKTSILPKVWENNVNDYTAIIERIKINNK